jgi:uncharacterized Zn finger protein
MESGEIVDVACPQCSPKEPTEHVVLKEGLMKCEECGHVHAVPVKKEKMLKLRVIVSRQDKSVVQATEVPEDEELFVDDEMIIDDGDEVSGVRIQSLEAKSGGRVKRAKAKDITTIWARAIDEVIVKVAIQKGPNTRSVNYKVNGDYEFVVGDEVMVKGFELKVTGLKEREGSHIDRKGKSLKAKNIKRVYTRLLHEAGIRGGTRSGTTGTFRGKKSEGP